MASSDEVNSRCLRPEHKQISKELSELRKKYVNLERKYEVLRSDNERLKTQNVYFKREIGHQKRVLKDLKAFRAAVKRELDRIAPSDNDDDSSQYSSFESDGETASYTSSESLSAYSPPPPPPPLPQLSRANTNSLFTQTTHVQPISESSKRTHSPDSDASNDSLQLHSFKRQHIETEDVLDEALSDDSLPPEPVPLDALEAGTEEDDDLPPPPKPFTIDVENARWSKELLYCVCSQPFITKDEAEKHLKTSELGCRAYTPYVLSLIPYECEQCGKQFIRRQALFAHMSHMKHQSLGKTGSPEVAEEAMKQTSKDHKS
jgi:hypothetical protein